MLDRTYAEEVLDVGRRAGLDAAGIAPARPFTRALAALETRRAAGLHGGMAFTYRNPSRSTDPGATLPNAEAIVVGALAYVQPCPPRPNQPSGRVARYVWRDHYAELRASLGVVAAKLEDDGWRARILVDDNALVDREAAYLAGLGWYGKNANILLPGRGSWFVLGSVVTDAPLPHGSPEADGCGRCRRCLDGCPTGAIIAPGVVDARRCLAWLVQAPGSFPRQYRAALGDRLYGCDDCQEVCPVNIRFAAPETTSHAADDGHHDPEAAAEAPAAWVALVELLAATDDELLDRHGRWYIPQRQPRWLRRNALVVLGNVGDGQDPIVVEALRRALVDADPTLRAHAVWAAAQLGRRDLLALVVDDPDPEVGAELAAAATE